MIYQLGATFRVTPTSDDLVALVRALYRSVAADGAKASHTRLTLPIMGADAGSASYMLGARVIILASGAVRADVDAR